jgi:hypothetical protein
VSRVNTHGVSNSFGQSAVPVDEFYCGPVPRVAFEPTKRDE